MILSTHWTGHIAFANHSVYLAELTVQQSVDEIHGILEFVSGKHKGKRYKIQGQIQKNVLTFYYYAEDEGATSQGAATFMLDENNYLGGLFAFYSEQSNSIGVAEGKFLPISMVASVDNPFVIT